MSPETDRETQILRLYDAARTVHLERSMDPGAGRQVTILYSRTNYDFDAELARQLGARKAGAMGVARFMLKHPVDILEINEPLAFPDMGRVLAALAVSRLRHRTRTRIVCYAIENLDPRAALRTLPPRARLARAWWLAIAPWVWRRLSRVAYGTEQSRQLYTEMFGGRTHQPAQRYFPHLPIAVSGLSEVGDHTAVFLGDLAPRKGFPLVLESWAAVRGQLPTARLIILGKGVGRQAAEHAAQSDSSIRVVIDPDRSTIFEELRNAKVLVLPSQRTPRWREQVGLPIVEGLAHGCSIVSTPETGLAPWLGEHGHLVIDDPSPHSLAEAIVKALVSTRTKKDITKDLPAIDGREEADRWLTQP